MRHVSLAWFGGTLSLLYGVSVCDQKVLTTKPTRAFHRDALYSYALCAVAFVSRKRRRLERVDGVQTAFAWRAETPYETFGHH